LRGLWSYSEVVKTEVDRNNSMTVEMINLEL
jgi:hypothetical protein